MVITGAHCLPDLPRRTAHPIRKSTFANLLGTLGSEATVWCKCLFCEPIADIAIIGSPDGQQLYDEAEAYEALVDACEPIGIARLTHTRPEHLNGGETVRGRP
jgi:hypothetical protein